jgi:hypothetical protein
MPYEFKDKIAVRCSELIGIHFTNYESLKKTIQRHKDKPYGIKKLQSGGNGRELLIDFDTLDIEIRNALGDPRKVTNWMDKFYTWDDAAASHYGAYRFENGGALSETHVQEYTINAGTIKACIALRAARERERLSKGGSLRGVPNTIWKDAMHFKGIQRMKYQYEHALPSNERRFLEAIRRFEVEGFDALISRKHNNKNAVKVTADVLELLNSLFAGTHLKPTATDVWRNYTSFLVGKLEVIHNETGEVINPESYPNLSDATVMAYLAKWDSKIGTWNVRGGNRQVYMNKFKTPHKMKAPKYSGSLLSVDDRQPPFVMPDGNRVWFYNAIDLSSEVWTAWVHGKSKEGIIVEFYRQIVRNYAKWGLSLPLELECEMSLNAGLRNTILADGALFRRVRIEANNAVGKKIEHFYRRIRYGKEKDLDGWVARPFARAEANQARSEKKTPLSYGQIAKQTIEVMEEWNNEPHSTIEGKTRWEVFLESQNPNGLPICWEILLPVIGYETKTSCKTGLVHLNNSTFCIAGTNGEIAKGDELINYMRMIEGKQILVRWLDNNDGGVLKAFAYKDGRVICELVEQPVYNRSTFERQAEGGDVERTKMSAYANTITAFGNQQRKNIAGITIIKRQPESKPEEKVRVVEVLEMPDDDAYLYEPVKRESKKETLWDTW